MNDPASPINSSHCFNNRDRDLKPRKLWLLLALLLFPVITVSATRVGERQIFGWVEHAIVSVEQVEMKAKLDTGATTSALHAVDIHRFRRDGRSMVRFVIEDPEAGRRITLERPLARRVRIKESDTDRYSSRPVVELWLCVGNIGKIIEVSLVDRSHFNYPLLIGRNFLAGEILVDSGETFTVPPACALPDGPS